MSTRPHPVTLCVVCTRPKFRHNAATDHKFQPHPFWTALTRRVS